MECFAMQSVTDSSHLKGKAHFVFIFVFLIPSNNDQFKCLVYGHTDLEATHFRSLKGVR